MIKAKPRIELNRLTHTYSRDGIALEDPSVTEVCSMFGRNYNGTDPFYAERGTAVHAGLELANIDALDWENLDPEIEGFLMSYAAVLSAGLEPIAWEKPLYSEKHRFCGTFDLIAKWKDEILLLDAKTSKSVDPVVELQLDGQQILIFENTPYKPDACGYLQLFGDGSEAKIKVVETGDFLSALEMYRWKKSHTRKAK